MINFNENIFKKTLENTEEAIKNGQSRDTSNIGYTRRRQTKHNHNTTQYVPDNTIRKQTQTTNENKT